MKAWKEIDEKQEGGQMDKFLTCLAIDQIVDEGAAVNTETLQKCTYIAAK